MSDDQTAWTPDDEDADDPLLGHIADALGPDPVPAGLQERIAGLFALRDLDRELVELLAAAQPETAGMRGTASQTAPLAFELADGTLSFEVSVEADGLHGQMLAGSLVEVSMESSHGERRTAPVDELGRFRFDDVLTGPVRLVLRDGSDRPSTTDWFLL